MKTSDTFPVTKNGKFFGYADARQIARSNGVLEIFDEAKAEAIEQNKVVEAQKQADEKSAEQRKVLEGKAANPADVKKAADDKAANPADVKKAPK